MTASYVQQRTEITINFIILSVAKSYKKHTNLSPYFTFNEVFSHLDNDKNKNYQEK